jgi:hypothetical protein
MNLREIKRAIRALPPEDLTRLDTWLRELAKVKGSKGLSPTVTRRELVERRQAAHITYRLERVRCGKVNCRCSGGELHGPYWYAYWTEGGRTRSRYIGKELPEPEQESQPHRVR